jgi:hypothetical protein
VEHAFHLGVKIIFWIIKIEHQVDKYKIPMKPRCQMMVGEDGWQVCHPLKVNGDDGQWRGVNLWPVLPTSTMGLKFPWLDPHKY